jgi:transposase-like protein
LAESKEEAERAFDHFINLYQSKYPKATHCLQKDRAALLAFYEYPAEGGRFSALWVHLRTTNPIESTFATVRLRTAKTRGCVSRQTILMLVFRLCQCAERYWRRLNGSHHLVSVLNGIQYINGIRPDPTEKDQDIGIAA